MELSPVSAPRQKNCGNCRKAWTSGGDRATGDSDRMKQNPNYSPSPTPVVKNGVQTPSMTVERLPTDNDKDRHHR